MELPESQCKKVKLSNRVPSWVSRRGAVRRRADGRAGGSGTERKGRQEGRQKRPSSVVMWQWAAAGAGMWAPPGARRDAGREGARGAARAGSVNGTVARVPLRERRHGARRGCPVPGVLVFRRCPREGGGCLWGRGGSPSGEDRGSGGSIPVSSS